MKDEYKWYNSVQFNTRDKVTENWPTEKEVVDRDAKLKPFLGMNVGGKKQVSTVIPPPVCDTTGQSNLGDLLFQNAPLGNSSHETLPIGNGSQLGQTQNSTNWNSQIKNLKGELVHQKTSRN